MKTLKKLERELNCEIEIDQISSQDKHKYHVNVTPTFIINDQVFSSGNVPTERELSRVLKPMLEGI